MLACRALELCFGQKWVKNYINRSQKLFYPFGGISEAEVDAARATITDFAAYVLSLRYNDNFHQWCQKVSRGKLKIEAAYSEAQVAFWFRQHSFQPEIVAERRDGKRTCDFRVTADFLDRPIDVEVTKILVSPQFSREKLLEKLRKKRKQLLQDEGYNIICINVPRNWLDHVDRLSEAALEFLTSNSSSHIDRVVFFADRWRMQSQHIERDVKFKEILNPKIYEHSHDENLIGAFIAAPPDSVERFVIAGEHLRDSLVTDFTELMALLPHPEGEDPNLLDTPLVVHTPHTLPLDLEAGFTFIVDWRLDQMEGQSVDGFTLILDGSDKFFVSASAGRQHPDNLGKAHLNFKFTRESNDERSQWWHSPITMGTRSRLLVEVYVSNRKLHVRSVNKENDLVYWTNDERSDLAVKMQLVLGGNGPVTQLGFNWNMTQIINGRIPQDRIVQFLDFDPRWTQAD